MSAAAAQQLNHEARWNAYFSRAGFVRCPHGFRKVLIACSQVEAALAWHVLQSTVGAKKVDKPEWVVLTEPEAARIANCSPNGAAKALDRLEELGILHSEKLGRTRRYRVQLENWDSLKARPVRQITKDEPEDEEDASATVESPAEPVAAFRAPSAAFVLMPTPNARPVPLVSAVRQVRAIGYDGVSLSLRIVGETLEVDVAKKGRTIETPECPNRADKSNNVNKTNPALRNMLNAELGAKLGPADEAIVARVAAALGSATIEDLRAKINSRRRSIESWGLIPQIARDVAHATPQPQPTPPETPFDLREEYEAHCEKLTRAWLDQVSTEERKLKVAQLAKSLKKTYPAAQFWTEETLREFAERQWIAEMQREQNLPTYREFVHARNGGTS